MSWLRIDDGFGDHPKVLQLSDAAFRLHVRAMCWCSRQETDGKLTKQAVRALGGSARLLKELVEARLWIPREDEHEIHDFLKYNPSRAQRAAERESTKQRVQRHRNGVTDPPRNGVTHPSGNGPVTAPPSPTPSPEEIQPAAGSQGPDKSRPAAGPGPAATAPIAERAQKVLDNPHDGRYSQPSKWPEVRRIGEAWSKPLGIRELKLRDDVGRDADLKAILAALADGYDPEILVSLGEIAAADGFIRAQKRPGPASFTAGVIRRLLASAPHSGVRSGPYEDTGELERALAEAGRS